MIKSWKMFNESIEQKYWLSIDDIKSIFQFILDGGYSLDVSSIFLGHNGWKNDVGINLDKEEQIEVFDINNGDIIYSNTDYKIGYKLYFFTENFKTNENLTDEFQSAIAQLKGDGYIIMSVVDDKGDTGIENIQMIDGSIINWIPESKGSKVEDINIGDIYEPSNMLEVIIYQDEFVELTDLELSELNEWVCDKIDKDKIYCHLDIDDMAKIILSRSSYQQWNNMLSNGIDYSDYSYDFQSSKSLIDYNLSSENFILLIKCLIKNIGVKSIFKIIDKEFENENHLIEYLKKNYRLVIEEIDELSVTEEIKQIVSDYEIGAQVVQNEKELHKEFNRKISNEGIEFTTIQKEGTKYYVKTLPNGFKQNVEYKDIVTYYELEFNIDWIKDYGIAFKKCQLSDIFYEWSTNKYFNNSLDPYFSDYGDVDKELMNKDIKSSLENYLNSKS